jgi:DNA-directed RNA polymerase subunit K/omega
MDEENDIEQEDTPAIPSEPVPPIHSRFLFVDIAGLRAKQLRRGARPRFDLALAGLGPKPERVAMEEVRRGLVYYMAPSWQAERAEGER